MSGGASRILLLEGERVDCGVLLVGLRCSAPLGVRMEGEWAELGRRGVQSWCGCSGLRPLWYCVAMHPKRLAFYYGPQEAVAHLDRPEVTAVLVIRDTYQPWDNPGFAQWLQVTFMSQK